MLLGEVEDITLEAKWRLKASKSDLLCATMHHYALLCTALQTIALSWNQLYAHFEILFQRIFIYIEGYILDDACFSKFNLRWIFDFVEFPFWSALSIMLCNNLMWRRISMTNIPGAESYVCIFEFSFWLCILYSLFWCISIDIIWWRISMTSTP